MMEFAQIYVLMAYISKQIQLKPVKLATLLVKSVKVLQLQIVMVDNVSMDMN